MKGLGHFFHPLTCRAIDNSCPMLLQNLPGAPELGSLGLDRVNIKTQIRSGKSSDGLEGLSQFQHLHDVLPDHLGSRSGEGHALRIPQGPPRFSQPQVIRPEIMSPLA